MRRPVVHALLVFASWAASAGGIASGQNQAARPEAANLIAPFGEGRGGNAVPRPLEPVEPVVVPAGGAEFAQPTAGNGGAYVLEADRRGVVCRAATQIEARMLEYRDPRWPMRFIKGGDAALKSQKVAAAGLTVQLRATAQLDGYPEARAAFIRAAQRWESVIHDPITIIIDVDFGPTRFGVAWDETGPLGSTSSDLRDGSYSSLTQAMLARFPSDQLYKKLPTTTLPTDQGAAAKAASPSSALRMLGLLPATQADADPAPGIGFNSAYSFDFDPTDGITAGQFDFDSVATHEIGHALGFDSLVGNLELHPNDPVMVSSWDLFRFRPGITLDTFTTASRVLASGGDQVFFDGVTSVPLSTGRTDNTGGDGQQASHWKDYVSLGSYIGIMVPALPRGVHTYLTVWDLDVLAWLSYHIDSSSFNQARITSVSPGNVPQVGSDFVLTVDGSRFSSGATILWKGSARQTTFVSATRLSAVISAADTASAGAASVEVANSGAIPSNMLFVQVGTPPSPCVPSSATLCLGHGRFGVTASWRKSDGTYGDGTAVRLTGDTGYFWFFDAKNIEITTKVLNGCGLTGNFWVFAAGLTNVGVTLWYTDTSTGTVKPYRSSEGSAFQPIQDTAAFPTCP
jgi:hypothetical protein